MRFLPKLAVVTLVAALCLPLPGQAQPALPDGPIPYEALANPAPRSPARPRPAPRPVGPPAASADGAAAAAAAIDSPTAQGVTPVDPAQLEAYLDGVIGSAMARDRIAGVTVSVVQDGQVILKKGYGHASLSPQRQVDPDRTLFRIGSISKTFTWILLMEEIQAGRIRIDAPINLYLPEQLQIRDQGFAQPVQVAHLLDHSPGFEDRVLGQLMERNFDRERPMAQYLRQERPRRVREPGQFPTYSNYGVGLAGQALVYVSGRPFEELVEGRITGPLGMTRTSFREPHPPRQGIPAPMPENLARDLSDGFRWSPVQGFQVRPFEYLGHLAPAGSASSTAADMARYMIVLLNDGAFGEDARLFGPATARAFRTPLRPNEAGINDWPHGFIAYPLPGGRKGYGHAGGTLSFASNMVMVPDLGLGVFISVNTENGAELAARLPAQVVAQFYGPAAAPPQTGHPDLRRLAGRYEGHYLGTRRAYVGLERFVGFILSGVSVQVTRDGRLVTHRLTGSQTWLPDGDPAQGRFISTTGPDRMVFDIAGGRATAFQGTFNEVRFQRVGLWSRPAMLTWLAGLAALAAIATLVGLALRNRRDLRQTQIQSQASLVQTIQAALWLLAMGLFGAWIMGASDTAQVVYTWPGARLLLASACALVAAVLTLFTLASLLSIWRGGRRLDSWPVARKLAFTATTLIYAAFAVVLFHWGALTPWSS
ncbi:MAG: serine hydrolase domain-containing protein [Phenylobacterium sp.]|uniref:serine hydrolase domain-containing protein n=1 Tax=Phenylobacterium sp. TaxID=1871053 RepID=UPI002725AE8A|nr:serine hydrolase domain-containing protein [Phenylobacterium sp.]MDO8902234.1 serine hydrolase domain-containing protein [Phenylobacterium sp.]